MVYSITDKNCVLREGHMDKKYSSILGSFALTNIIYGLLGYSTAKTHILSKRQ